MLANRTATGLESTARARRISPIARRRRIVARRGRASWRSAGGPELKALDITRAQNEIDRAFFKNQTKPQINVVGGYTLSGLAGRSARRARASRRSAGQRRHALYARLNELSRPRQPRPARPAPVIDGTAAVPPFFVGGLGTVAQQPVRAPLPDRAGAAADGSAAAQPHGAGEPRALGDRRDADRAPAPAARAGDRKRSARRDAGGALVGAAPRGGVLAAPLRARAVPRASGAASSPG